MSATPGSKIPAAERASVCPPKPHGFGHESSSPVRRATAAMGTFLHLELHGAEPAALHGAADRAFALAHRLSHQFSRFEPDGEVGRLNAWPAHRPFEASLRLRRLLATALRIWRASDGAFDPTPLAGSRRGPAIRIEGTRVIREDPDAQLDLGAIAKGFIIDEIVSLLRRADVTAGLVNAGGDIRAFGDRTWCIQLRDPHRPGRPIGNIPIRDAALCVSATTFQPGHIRDPRRAKTAGGPTTAAAVVARTAAESDAWATALFVSARAGLRKWFSHRAMAGLVIESSGPHALRSWRTRNFPTDGGPARSTAG